MMQIKWDYMNKNILVTGGASGLGLSIVREFEKVGANFCIAVI